MTYKNPILRRGLVLTAALSSLIPAVSFAQLRNAWKIDDPDGTSGSTPHYSVILPQDVQGDVTTSGFRFTIEARLIFGATANPSMTMLYGLGDRRFLVWFDLDSLGGLTATLEGGGTYTLTTGGTGTAFYHTHEILYDATAGTASYLFDGQVKADSWAPSETDFTAGAVYWGSGSSGGEGEMNFHSVTFEVAGEPEASYDAGTSPATAPDPKNQGWNHPPPGTGSVAGISPDEAPLAVIPTATTLTASPLDPHQASLSGEIDQGNLAATVWFEWGTDTNYGESTPPKALLSDTDPFDLSETISGLEKGVTYHFRCVASNLMGIHHGEDQVFTTPDAFSVTSLADSGPGTLRQHIADALPGDTITFATTTTNTTDTIELTSGELLITKDLTIEGPGAEALTLNGNRAHRVFNIALGSSVGISGLTIAGGQPADAAPGRKGRDGGGIYNFGTLTLTACYLRNNRAGSGGIGDHGSDGNLLNAATRGSDGGDGGNGGGVYNNNGNLNLIGCSFGFNESGAGGMGGDGGTGFGLGDDAAGGGGGDGGIGGAIYNHSGSVSLTNCTVWQNFPGGGGTGGLGGDGETRATGGDTGQAGGIYNLAALTLISSTVSSVDPPGVGDASLFNSIVPSISGRFTAVSSLINVDPQLEGFGYHGGPIPIPTTPPRAGSPAIDGGDDSVEGLPATDQRGYARRVGTHVDIGAVEYIPERTVTTNADSGPGSLREALLTVGFGGVISFSSSLAGETITLTSGTLLANYVTIAGPQSANVIINGDGKFRILSASGNVTLDSLTLTNGFSRDGGAVRLCNSKLSINSSTISGNMATSDGGAIYSDCGPEISINNSTISGNFATSHGGAIYLYSGGTLSIENSTISGNSAGSTGGGIYARFGSLPAFIGNSTISGNSAGTEVGGVMWLTNFPLQINSSILAGNSAPDFADFSGSAVLENSLLGIDPLLAPLGDYGGLTQTMPPLAGSPAIDTGDDSVAGSFATDQRGYPRMSGAHVDIGAVESQSAPGITPLLLRAAVHPVEAPGESPATFDLGLTCNSVPNMDFTVVASPDPARPLLEWIPLGLMTQDAPGVYEFMDRDTAHRPIRFYRVLTP